MHWSEQQLSDGPAPKWWQIAERLRGGIAEGVFAPGSALPSEAELNRLFGVSRTTARAALDKLKHEGLITRRSGEGSIVKAPYVEQPVTSLSSFSEDMAAKGLVASYETESVALRPSPLKVAEAFGVSPGSRLLRVRRRLLADGESMGLSRSWISVAAIGNHPLPTIEELDRRSLYHWLEGECGVRITGGTETIEAGIASGRLASSIGSKSGAAMLIARRQSVNSQGEVIELAKIHYRADRYRFTLEMKRTR